MKLLNELWENYKIHVEEYEKDCIGQDCCDVETEMLFDFIDNYVIYTHKNLALLGELLLSNYVEVEDIEYRIKYSGGITELTFLLIEDYIYGRKDHEERLKELNKQVEEIDQRRKKKFLYADFVDEGDIL